MHPQQRSALHVTLTVVVVAGLAIDAIAHLVLASTYDANRTSVLSEGDLFRVEAGLAILAAIALVVRPRRYTALFAFLVAGGGAVLVTVYRYVDVGRVGVIPQMYEDSWTPSYANPWKLMSLWAEVAAGLAALALFLLLHAQARRVGSNPNPNPDPNADPVVG